MEIILESFAGGDVWFWAVAALGVVGAVALPVQLWFESTGRRVSHIWAWVVPASVAAVSLGVTALRIGEAGAAASAAPSGPASKMIAEGLGAAIGISVLGALINALLCACIPLRTLYSQHRREADEVESRAVWGGIVLVVSSLGAGIATYQIVAREMVQTGLLLGVATLAVGGFACAWLSRQMPSALEHGPAAKAAADRWSAAAGIWLSTASATFSVAGLTFLSMVVGIGATDPETEMQLLRRGAAAVQNTSAAGSYLTLAAMIAAGVTVASAGNRALDSDALTTAGAIVLLWLPAAGAFVYVMQQMSSVAGGV